MPFIALYFLSFACHACHPTLCYETGLFLDAPLESALEEEHEVGDCRHLPSSAVICRHLRSSKVIYGHLLSSTI